MKESGCEVTHPLVTICWMCQLSSYSTSRNVQVCAQVHMDVTPQMECSSASYMHTDLHNIQALLFFVVRIVQVN